MPRLLFLLVLILAGCGEAPPPTYQGYVEGEYVDVAVPVSGRVEKLFVSRGQWVDKGAQLFALEAEPEREGVAAAAARLKELEHRLEDARKGARPSEIEAIETRIREAAASLQLAKARLARIKRLGEQQFASKQQLDEALTQRQAAAARLAALRAELATARLGARSEAIAALVSAAAAAKAELQARRWLLEQKQRTASARARVVDIFYQVGEYVPQGRPVLRLLPPAND